jgi:hypothetical protein
VLVMAEEVPGKSGGGAAALARVPPLLKAGHPSFRSLPYSQPAAAMATVADLASRGPEASPSDDCRRHPQTAAASQQPPSASPAFMLGRYEDNQLHRRRRRQSQSVNDRRRPLPLCLRPAVATDMASAASPCHHHHLHHHRRRLLPSLSSPRPPPTAAVASLFSELSQIEEERAVAFAGGSAESEVIEEGSAFEPVVSLEKELAMRFPPRRTSTASATVATGNAGESAFGQQRMQKLRRGAGIRGYRRVLGSQTPAEWTSTAAAEADETRSLYHDFAYSSSSVANADERNSVDSGTFTASDGAASEADHAAKGPKKSKKWLANIYKLFGLSQHGKDAAMHRKVTGESPREHDERAEQKVEPLERSPNQQPTEESVSLVKAKITLDNEEERGQKNIKILSGGTALHHTAANSAGTARFSFGRVKRFAVGRRLKRKQSKAPPSKSGLLPQRKMGVASMANLSVSVPNTPRPTVVGSRHRLTSDATVAVASPPLLSVPPETTRSFVDLRQESQGDAITPGLLERNQWSSSNVGVSSRRRSRSSSALVTVDTQDRPVCEQANLGRRSRVWLQLDQHEWLRRTEDDQALNKSDASEGGGRLAASTGSLLTDLTRSASPRQQRRQPPLAPPTLLHLFHVCAATCDFQRGLSAPGAAAGQTADVLWYRFLGRYYMLIILFIKL